MNHRQWIKLKIKEQIGNLKAIQKNKLPKVLFIETTNYCNRSCKFCYWGHFPKQKFQEMDWELFVKIIDDVRCNVYSLETINLYMINEPFLDSRLRDRILYIKNAFGQRQLIRIFTNSTLLTTENVQELLSIPYVTIYASVYDRKYLENLDAIKLSIKPVRHSYLYINDMSKKTEWDTQLILHKLDCSQYLINKPITHGLCVRLQNTIVVRWDGTMVWCCTDVMNKTAYHKLTLNDKNLVDIWRENTTEIGYMLEKGIRNSFCRECSRYDDSYW